MIKIIFEQKPGVEIGGFGPSIQVTPSVVCFPEGQTHKKSSQFSPMFLQMSLHGLASHGTAEIIF